MATIKGKVIDHYSNQGIEDAYVSVDPEGISNRHLSTETNKEGDFCITNIPAGTYTLHVQFSPKGMVYSYGESIKNIELTEDTKKDLIIPVEVSGVLIGKVNDVSNSSPIQGATIRIVEDTGGQIASPTDENGNYSISFIKPGSYTVTGIIEGYEPITRSVYIDQVTKGKGETKLDFLMHPLAVDKLPETGIVRGNVRNQFGRALLGTRIELVSEGCLKVTSVAKDWINGYKGNFSFSDVPPGQYRLVVSRPDYETIVREVDVERGKAKWVNDLVLKLAVSPLPPELEYIQIYPEGINLGEDIKITIKARDPEIISTSAHMWGPSGWNIGFSLDHTEKGGGRSRIFRNWQIVGIFKIDSVYFTNKYGQTFTISVMATFEVFPPNESPLSPDFEIFGVPDYD